MNTSKFSDSRPPDATEISMEDFDSCGWDPAKNDDSAHDDWWTFFAAMGTQAHQAGKSRIARVLWLLADAVSLQLLPRQLNEPFRHTHITEFKLPRDVGSFESHVPLIAQIYPKVSDPFLRARLADIAWISAKPRNRHHALAAVQAYSEVPLDLDSWLMRGAENCWRRGLVLATQVQEKDESERSLPRMAQAMAAKCEVELAPGEETDICLQLIEMLIDHGLAIERYEHIAALLTQRAQNERHKVGRFGALAHLRSAKRLYTALKDQERCADIALSIAEIHVDEATQRITGKQLGFTAAASFYNDARQELLSIPKQLRTARNVDAELQRLHELAKEAGERSLEEFTLHRGAEFDVSDAAEAAIAGLKGKDFLDALLAFASVKRWTRAEMARAEAKSSLAEFVSNSIFSTSKLGSGGRLVQTTAPFDTDAGDEANKAQILAKMVEHHLITMKANVHGAIAPAQHQLLLDHLIEEQDLKSICEQSFIVPQGRAGIVAKGLKAGFEGNLDIALHLLVPQLEHMVRVLLQRNGVKTTTIETNGVWIESGLSKLVTRPEMDKIFGPDITFEILALFCDQSGPNLRNDLAHGLLDPRAPSSYAGVYAWWMIFKLVFDSYWYPPSNRG